MFVIALLATAALSGCGARVDCEWVGRPDCEPVGTTIVVSGTWNQDPLCTETYRIDEEGPASIREIGCP
jgi:hypothetical protein